METAVEWLLASDEPAIRLAAKGDLLDMTRPPEASQVLGGPKVRALLADQQENGSFGVHPYGKWRGAHWRLVSLVELGVPTGEPRHSDILQALVLLVRMGHGRDPRTGDAVKIVEQRRLKDGRWRTGGRWWKPPGSAGGNVEVVDWGRTGPNEMITLNALRVLRAVRDCKT